MSLCYEMYFQRWHLGYMNKNNYNIVAVGFYVLFPTSHAIYSLLNKVSVLLLPAQYCKHVVSILLLRPRNNDRETLLQLYIK